MADVRNIAIYPPGFLPPYASGATLDQFAALVGANPSFPVPSGPIVPMSAAGVFNLNAQNLSHWRAAVARVRAGTGRGRVLCVGDSTTQGYGAQGSASATGCWPLSYPSMLSKLLSTYYVQTTTNSFFGDTSAVSYPLYDTRVTLGANWASDGTHPTFGGRWFKYDNLAVNNISFTPSGNVDTVIVFNWKGSAGTFTFNVDGGASLGTSTALSTGWQALQGTVSKAAHTINVVPNNNGVAYIGGMLAYDSTVPSIDIFQGGYNGATVSFYLGTGQTYNAAATIPFLAPDLTIINLTINDITTYDVAGIPNYIVNMQTLISAAIATGDVILVMGVPGSTNTAAQLSAYRDALMQLARTNNLPVIDLTTRWGSYAAANAVMPYGSGVHPSQVGYADIAQAIFDALTTYQ